jgi:hypothetical protein
MTTVPNNIYLLLALILWITAYISSFAIQGGTPLGPLLYILGSVFFLLTQRPPSTATNQVQPTTDEGNDLSVGDEETEI